MSGQGRVRIPRGFDELPFPGPEAAGGPLAPLTKDLSQLRWRAPALRYREPEPGERSVPNVLAEIAREWLSAPWDWPSERSSRLETAAPLEVGTVFALHGPGWPEVPARFYEVFEADGCRSRCVPWPRAGGDA